MSEHSGKGRAGASKDQSRLRSSRAQGARREVVKPGRPGHAGRSIKWRSMVDLLIFLIGLGIFMYPLVAAYVNYQSASSAIDNYDSIVERLTPAEKAEMWAQAKRYDEELGKPTLRDPFKYHKLKYPVNLYNRTLNVDGKGMMAYVEIPKISVKLPVYHGTSDDVLLKGTGHIATTHIPTDNKTLHGVITGHTGAVGHIFFDNLTQMKKGDVFQVRVLDHHLSYKIDQIRVIMPNDVHNLQPVEGRNYVTLLTCTPYGINSHRLIVRGRYIGDNIPGTPPQGAPKWVLWIFLLALLITALLMHLVTRKRRQCRIAIALIHRNYGLGPGGDPGLAGGLPGPGSPGSAFIGPAGVAPAGGQMPRAPAGPASLARSSLPAGGWDDASGPGAPGSRMDQGF
ncbi:LPXTG-site transpeptidase (sortase) family protein [Bifidobacterium actinocoloniiforme DSM 22766]|uniref:LPXTG-site transpeptidase (Sortase) family protein n=1 Tax=Bifidobacterium actinocoloniiforme DSM 22766 TaxID=1437605 RepID=A0A086YWF3_9BIFI|nr:class C sortase [Bifidobacterium actinocoloniiforme]KFI38603.1 LPXTG-site transpeptidase (sortase) family protein [Bifidobacterium actinocoloniiforme DSM 22766]